MSLIMTLLSAYEMMEKRCLDMELEQAKYADIFNAFHARPNFRFRVHNLMISFTDAISNIGSWLLNDNDFPTPVNVHAIVNLLHSLKLFEQEYDYTRRTIYYFPDDLNESKGCKPLHYHILYQMNYFIFLMDMTCIHLIQFWTDEELNLCECTSKLTCGPLHTKDSNPFVDKLHYGYNFISRLLFDLFPSQKHLLPENWNSIFVFITANISYYYNAFNCNEIDENILTQSTLPKAVKMQLNCALSMGK
jgi:hypothetical protein